MSNSWRGTAMFLGVASVLGVAAAAHFAEAETAATPEGAPPGAVVQAPGTRTTTGGSGADRSDRSDRAKGSSGGATSVPKRTASGSAAGATTTVVGSVAQTPYGPLQVAVTFDGGRIASVQALRNPRGGRSDGINAFALPILGREVVAAQSSHIDAVSGATYTSAGYSSSVQYAIDHR